MEEQKATNVVWHELSVSQADREKLRGHKGVTLWFTGLSASGKSTLANAAASALHQRGVGTFVLDGDNIRQGLNKNLGFSPEDRVENIRRIGEVAKLFSTAGIVNLTAFISPYEADRNTARDQQPETFLLVYCKADIEVCESRDPKGMYKKARAGQIKDFTGVNAPYEEPSRPDLVVDTGKKTLEACVAEVISLVERRGFVKAAK
jgi:adenylylsulfate kinase